ncbi:MAG: hypothetical protein ABSH25_20065 [Syntrophorhabdales bacterium]|jgi:hypothetical protein
MTALMRTWRLESGLIVEVEDESRNYYGDYHHLKLVIRCRIAVKAEHLEALEGSPSYARVVETMGPSVEYLRVVGRAGVAGKDVASIKDQLLRSFEENALPYFNREGFEAKFVRKRFGEIEKDLSKRGRNGKRDGD